MDIAVVGGGLYGIHCAKRLASEGCDVTIFEKNSQLMSSASKVNQWRLHTGFHYPRSKSTSKTCRDTQKEFRKYYKDAIVTEDNHYYCIASEKTKTTPEEFISHAETLDLDFEQSNLDLVNEDKIDLTLRVQEDRINPKKLRKICKERLEENKVSLELNSRIDSLDELEDYDYIVVATYANSNWVFDEGSDLRRNYKFELVEKPVVELPSEFDGRSLVIMDGPFMCFDPYEEGDKFLLGNVVHAIHETQEGEIPEFDEKYDKHLDNGVVEDPEITKIKKFISHGSEYIPGLAEAEHLGSMYTIRTTLPNREDTDARPTLVEKEDNVFRVFSGKLSACIQAGDKVTEEIIG